MPVYQYPPDLFDLLVDTIPLLCRSKDSVLGFFTGAGVPARMTADIAADLKRDKDSYNKYVIARTVLTRVNEGSDPLLTARREIIKRIVEFEDFSRCWPNDVLKAKGCVAEVQKLVNVRDSFTRMSQERDREHAAAREEKERAAAAARDRRARLDTVKSDLFALFGESNPQARGKKLEGVLNSLFDAYGVLIREAFSLKDDGGGVVEQIDGVVEIDGVPYLVEMKWLSSNVDVNDVSRHLVRLFNREGARGIFIANPGFTSAAISTCKDALGKLVISLVTLEEIVRLLDADGDLLALLRQKIHATIVDRQPFVTLAGSAR